MSSMVRRFGLLAAFALFGVYAAVVLRGPQGLPALAQKRRLIRDLQEQNATITRENQQKRDRIEILKHSANAQEMEVRKEMKLQRPGETTFILPETGSKPTVPASKPALDDPAQDPVQ
ncbi:MAG: septum formation initiator family protein [Acidobacteria bacterium]|nr:septum formation initiator family protein [Acidobacteriota bacterium]